MMRVEVRCCCDASKVLGTVEVNESWLLGSHIVFPLSDRLDGDLHSLALDVGDVKVPPTSPTTGWTTARAIKAHETPIATLMRLPTFVPGAISDARLWKHMWSSRTVWQSDCPGLSWHPIPYMHEDELPESISDAEYDVWFEQSLIPDGVGCRIGPVVSRA